MLSSAYQLLHKLFDLSTPTHLGFFVYLKKLKKRDVKIGENLKFALSSLRKIAFLKKINYSDNFKQKKI